MQNSHIASVTGKKAESTVRLEEEARQVIEEALIAAEAKSATRARIKAQDEVQEADGQIYCYIVTLSKRKVRFCLFGSIIITID